MNGSTKIQTSEPATAAEKLVACHECDYLHRVEQIPEDSRASCVRCGGTLYRNSPDDVKKGLALSISAFIFFFLANCFPFISMNFGGRVVVNSFLSGAIEMYKLGYWETGLLVFLTSFLFPIISICGMLFIFVCLHFGRKPAIIIPIFRITKALLPWSLIAIFMLGVLIAIVKLMDSASIIPGISLYGFAALVIVTAGASAKLHSQDIWGVGSSPTDTGLTGKTAEQRGLVACRLCKGIMQKTSLNEEEQGSCPQCGNHLHSRKPNSEAKTFALVCTSAMLLLPANLYPVMTVIQFGRGDPSTIFSGITALIAHGFWGLAMIIFFASIVVPVIKLIVLGVLLYTVKKGSNWRNSDRSHLYKITEIVGAWSMVDIYVVTMLTGLVDFGAFSLVRPGIGIVYFGAVVVFTMLAAHSFDPRIIWDRAGEAN